MQDIPKLFTAFAEWSSCILIILEYYTYLRGKMNLRKYAAIIISLLTLSGIQLFCGMVSNWLWLLGMAVAAFTMFLLLKVVLELPFTRAAFETAGVFLKAEFVAAFQWQIYSFYKDGFRFDTLTVEMLFGLGLYLLCFGLIYALERRFLFPDGNFIELPVRNGQAVLIWGITVLIFALSNLSYINISSPFRGTDAPTIFNIRTMVDLAGLFMFETVHIQMLDAEKNREIDAIRYILKTQYIQFRDSQENINLINQKYHDLKHQLNILRNEKNDSRREQYLDEIESGIREYESRFKTGNSVLDTILSTKSQQCEKWHIIMTVVADGRLLNNIHVMDICTIFGNALENALEYEVQIPNVEERMIRVSVSQKASFVCILIENYYETETEADPDRFTRTSKSDDRFHGFGIRSIQHSVHKYSGYVNIKVQEHWFRVEIMIPVKAE